MKGWGYNVERHKTNDVDKNLLYKCLITKNVVIFGGKKKKSTGHVWLVDGGVFEYSGNMMIGCTNIQVKAIHCNFGWNRANNGWYAIKDGLIIDPLIALLKMAIIQLMIKIHRMVIFILKMITSIFMKRWELKFCGKI